MLSSLWRDPKRECPSGGRGWGLISIGFVFACVDVQISVVFGVTLRLHQPNAFRSVCCCPAVLVSQRVACRVLRPMSFPS